METSGLSLVLDLFDCQTPALASEDLLVKLFLDALHDAGFGVVDRLCHHFPGEGLTFIAILQQSHAILHTWPEHSFISIDVYSCGQAETVRPALDTLAACLTKSMAAHKVSKKMMQRGA